MALDDTVHLPCLHDDKNTFRRTILAGCGVIIDIGIDLRLHHLDCRQDLQNRNPDVRQETKFERDLEVAEILIHNA